MKIIHLCLACFYRKGFGYQENLLPKAHKLLGNEVYIMAPATNLINKKENLIDKDYINEDNIPVIIIKKENGYVNRLFNRYIDFLNKIKDIKPDIIFVHGGQSLDLLKIKKYIKNNPNCKLYVDQHADYYNTPVTTFRRKVVGKYMMGYYMRKDSKYVSKYWGTTPWRCQYLNDIYGIKKEKIGLLVMGGDDEKIHFENQSEIKETIRNKHNIKDSDFLIITGGKIDKTKNIHLLTKAINEIDNDNIKLIVFGNLTDDMKVEFNKYTNDNRIKLIGWIPSDEAYNYFLASDLAVFPGTHSVLWEQACACGIPIVVKDWEGMHHVDVGGNCKFIKEDNSVEIQKILEEIVSDNTIYNNMYKVAQEKGIKEFSYLEIAKRSIEEVVG